MRLATELWCFSPPRAERRLARAVFGRQKYIGLRTGMGSDGMRWDEMDTRGWDLVDECMYVLVNRRRLGQGSISPLMDGGPSASRPAAMQVPTLSDDVGFFSLVVGVPLGQQTSME